MRVSTRAHSDQAQWDGAGERAQAERYRVAAENALQQLEWTIGYLHGIRKTSISKALAANRYYIRRSLMRKPDVEDPSAKTGET